MGCLHCSRREVVSCQRVQVECGSRETSERWKDAQHADLDIAPVLLWVEKGEQPPKEELSPENPATKRLVEQWDTLRVQDSVIQKRWEDAATQERTWLLVVPLSLRAELLDSRAVFLEGGTGSFRRGYVVGLTGLQQIGGCEYEVVSFQESLFRTFRLKYTYMTCFITDR